MRTQKETRQCDVTLSFQMIEALDFYAEIVGLSRSAAIRQFVIKGLNEAQIVGGLLPDAMIERASTITMQGMAKIPIKKTFVDQEKPSLW